MSADTWTAIATWIAVSVAMLGACIAWIQIKQNYDLRVEEAQPYVAVFTEARSTIFGEVYLVVKNFGLTAAHDIHLEFDPPPMYVGGEEGHQPLLIPDSMTLVPGQDWRTLWDFVGKREGAEGLANQHRVLVKFKGSDNKPLTPLTYDLDFGTHMIAGGMRNKTLDDVVNALSEISSELKNRRYGLVDSVVTEQVVDR